MAFLSPDPSGPVDSWDLYQYGFGTPATWWDPTGLSSIGRLWGRIRGRLGSFVSQSASLLIGYTPAGDVLDAVSANIGQDIITGERLSGAERLASAGSALLPFVSFKSLAALKAAFKKSPALRKLVGKLRNKLGRLFKDFVEFIKKLFDKLKDKATVCEVGKGFPENGAFKQGGSSFDLGAATSARGSRASFKLGRALEAAGHVRQKGDEAHHIVAKGAKGAKEARAVFG
ncbi:MAG: hypothetical protein DWQ01_17605 [Planctomycetota bacterium]|nr:MAG: hypothetical protein DWQ01_17605 [Planctomycetota bacterium]